MREKVEAVRVKAEELGEAEEALRNAQEAQGEWEQVTDQLQAELAATTQPQQKAELESALEEALQELEISRQNVATEEERVKVKRSEHENELDSLYRVFAGDHAPSDEAGDAEGSR